MNFMNRYFFALLGFLILGALAYYFSDIVAYILISWVLSLLGKPLADFLKNNVRIGRLKIGSSLASLLTIFVFYTVFVGIILVFVPTIVAQARNLTSIDYQGLGEKLRVPFFHFDAQLHQIGLLQPDQSLSTKTQEILSNWFKPTLLGDFLGAFLGLAGNIVVTFASVTFILFFFLKESALFSGMVHAFVPNEQEKKVQLAIQESSAVLTRYFRGLLLQTAAFATMVALLLTVMSIDNALLIGSLGGAFNVVPYVGPIIGMLFGVFITISSHLDSDFALMIPILIKLVGVFLLVQTIDNNLVGPFIVSKSVQAHPLEIFIVTLASAKIGGVVGMVIGVPVYTVIRIIARKFFSEFKVVKILTERNT
jgi:predicted PurR-regulated permease PerM